jgi:HD-GYP domain-containing protein (c-di-GMP phosphodiesterase class II)
VILREMPVALRRYVVAVIVGGPLLASIAALGGVHGLGPTDWARACLLSLLAALAYGRPLRIGHKYSFDVSDVIHVAMVLLFPPSLPGVLVIVAAGLHFARRPMRSVEELFNLSQNATYVTVGALCLAVFRDGLPMGPSVAGLAPPGAIAAPAVAMLVVNAGLVAGAITLQTHARFWRLWRGEVVNIAGTYTALVALGVVAALLIRDHPLALAPLVLPAVLAQYALRREVQLRADTRAALAALVDVIELRDPYTAGHSERVAGLARALAVRLGMTGEEADLIETAGRLHDLGKAATNPGILQKQGRLDEAEWQEMRQHPVAGAAVVGRFSGYRGCAKLVRHHHERWDGSGYPDGLGGEDIPFGARILAVADAFDALTSARAYRPAGGPDAAIRILQEGAGTQWDQRVVQALVAHEHEMTNARQRVGASRPIPA